MSYLKNILLSPLLIFITPFSFGQKPIFGIKAGIALSNSKITFANPALYGLIEGNSPRVGVLAGVYLDIPSGKKIIIRPGTEVVTKETVDQNPGIFNFVDFPLSILYRINYTHGHLIVGGGPSIGIPINSYNSNSSKTEFGVNGLVGYELPIGFSLNLNYNYGLSNASNDEEYIKKLSNRYLGITMGYSF